MLHQNHLLCYKLLCVLLQHFYVDMVAKAKAEAEELLKKVEEELKKKKANKSEGGDDDSGKGYMVYLPRGFLKVGTTFAAKSSYNFCVQ